jgi:biotin operon repressor
MTEPAELPLDPLPLGGEQLARALRIHRATVSKFSRSK